MDKAVEVKINNLIEELDSRENRHHANLGKWIRKSGLATQDRENGIYKVIFLVTGLIQIELIATAWWLASH